MSVTIGRESSSVNGRWRAQKIDALYSAPPDPIASGQATSISANELLRQYPEAAKVRHGKSGLSERRLRKILD
jgi:hypothetical protein